MGLNGGFLDGIPPEGVREALERAWAAVQRDCPQVRRTLTQLPGGPTSHISRPLIACGLVACSAFPINGSRLVSSLSACSAIGQVIADIEASGKLSEDQRAEIAQAFKQLALQAAQ